MRAKISFVHQFARLLLSVFECWRCCTQLAMEWVCVWVYACMCMLAPNYKLFGSYGCVWSKWIIFASRFITSNIHFSTSAWHTHHTCSQHSNKSTLLVPAICAWCNINSLSHLACIYGVRTHKHLHSTRSSQSIFVKSRQAGGKLSLLSQKRYVSHLGW